MKKLFLCLILICQSQGALAADQVEINAAGLQMYSDMGFIRDEGEYSGLQIILVPYNPHYGSREEKVLWRSGNGNLDTPLLLDGVREGNKITLTVPEENAEHGKWVLTIKENGLSAQGPRALRHELKEVHFTTP